MNSYPNPFIPQRADPYVTKGPDGFYYFTASYSAFYNVDAGYDRIILRKSDTVIGLATAEEHTIWKAHNEGVMSKHIWAPEIHYIGGKWYIFFAAGEKETIWNIRPFVLMCEGQDPINDKWIELGKMQASEGDNHSFTEFSLDMTYFENNGKHYLIWAEKLGDSSLFMAEINENEPNKLISKPILLTKPEYDWECVRHRVNEGASVLKTDDKVYVFFSASGTGAEYCMGMLYADKNADLMDINSWTKSPVPALQTEDLTDQAGPGHNSFVVDENGNLQVVDKDALIGDVVIPSTWGDYTVTTIQEYGAFSECNNMTSVTFPNTLTSITNVIFSNCANLEWISIPESLTQFGGYGNPACWGGCPKLTAISVAESNPNYTSVDGVLYNKDITTIIQCPMGKTGTFTIPSTVRTVTRTSFSFSKLSEINIPEGVTTIEADAFYRPAEWVKLSAFVSVGDWRWKNDVEAVIYDNYSDNMVGTVGVYSDGLPVGGAPQTQVGASVTLDIPGGFSMSADWQFNDRMYAEFDPVSRTSALDRSPAYRIPSYHLLGTVLQWSGVFARPGSSVAGRQAEDGCRVTVFITGSNLLDTMYIERGKDGAGHDLASFRGYWGFGRNFSLGVRFLL